MTAWFDQYGYIVWGLGCGGSILAFYLFARSHLEGEAMSLWRRLRWTAFAGIAVLMILMLGTAITDAFAPSLGLFDLFLPNRIFWIEIPVFAAAWFAAPRLSGKLPTN